MILDEDDIYGDGVNVAARLEELAEPGGICVSSEVHGQVEGRLKLAFEDLGERRVKNIARPLRVYRVSMAPADAPIARKAPDQTSDHPCRCPTVHRSPCCPSSI